MAVPDQVILSLQVLQELPKAEALLAVCMAMVQRAGTKWYSSDTMMISSCGAMTRLCCPPPEVMQAWCSAPLRYSTTFLPTRSAAAGAGPDATTWSRWLHQAVMPAFKDVATVREYLSAQAKIIGRAP